MAGHHRAPYQPIPLLQLAPHDALAALWYRQKLAFLMSIAAERTGAGARWLSQRTMEDNVGLL